MAAMEKAVTPSGMGGWLAVLAACLMLVGPIAVFWTLLAALSGPERLHPELVENPAWVGYKFATYFGGHLRNLVSVVMGVLLFAHRERATVRWTLAALWVSYPLYIALQEFLLPWLLFAVPTVDRSAALQHLGATFVFALGWTLYLMCSRRVRNTYF